MENICFDHTLDFQHNCSEHPAFMNLGSWHVRTKFVFKKV